VDTGIADVNKYPFAGNNVLLSLNLSFSLFQNGGQRRSTLLTPTTDNMLDCLRYVLQNGNMHIMSLLVVLSERRHHSQGGATGVDTRRLVVPSPIGLSGALSGRGVFLVWMAEMTNNFIPSLVIIFIINNSKHLIYGNFRVPSIPATFSCFQRTLSLFRRC